jgi:formate hydrogenlyase subunit 4
MVPTAHAVQQRARRCRHEVQHESDYALARLLIFPGLLFAVPAAWFFLWVERKAVAMMQGRIGPPFMQPFFDFIKLLGKTTPPRSGMAAC